MRILLICQAFAPDNVIGAVRITKFAKYLQKQGHCITVISSGKIEGRTSLASLEGTEEIDIYSYEMKRKITKNDYSAYSNKIVYAKSENKLMKYLKTFLHYFYDIYVFYYASGKQIRDKIIDLYEMEPSLRNYDVVMATFNPLGCIQAAKYISDIESARFVIDFRDLMTNSLYTPLLRFVNIFTQRKYVRLSHASICVSEGNHRLLSRLTGCGSKIFTVNNGYDGAATIEPECRSEDSLTICYTGTLYGGNRDLRPLFKAIAEVKNKEELNVRFVYAGKDGVIAKQQAAAYGLESLVEDKGLVPSEEAQKIQNESDIFVVVSWNTKQDQGILTGKFYEALRCRKPIIAIVTGEVPQSELRYLIEKYSLGVCYEDSDKGSTVDSLESYLFKQYDYKKHEGNVLFHPKEEVFEIFNYQTIVKKLAAILEME